MAGRRAASHSRSKLTLSGAPIPAGAPVDLMLYGMIMKQIGRSMSVLGTRIQDCWRWPRGASKEKTVSRPRTVHNQELRGKPHGEIQQFRQARFGLFSEQSGGHHLRSWLHWGLEKDMGQDSGVSGNEAAR